MVDDRSVTGGEELLTVSHLTGVTPRSEKSNVTMFMAETLEGYKRCRPGDLVVNTMWAWMGALGMSKYEGIVSPSYHVYRPARPDLDSRYYDYLFRTPEYVTEITRNSRGVWTSRLRLYPGEFLDMECFVPPASEQRAIANFLDRKTAAIDALIAKKERLLALLAEKRAALIHQAVTKGLDPSVPMKDSGVPWIGEIPKHWEVMQLRRQLTLQRGVDITKDEQTDGPVPVISSGGVSSFHNVAIAEGPGVVVGRKGSAGTVHWTDQDYWPHDTTLYVKWFGGNNARFIYYKLIAMKLQTFDTGSANPTVNRNLVHPVHVSWPARSEQDHIAEQLDSRLEGMGRLARVTTDSIGKLREYRQALITAAVTGQLDIEATEHQPIPETDEQLGMFGEAR